MLQPDIEIYIQDAGLKAIKDWLTGCFDSFEEGQHRGNIYNFQVFSNGHAIPVMVVEKAAGKHFTSVWFDSSETPWNDDVSCARDTNQKINKTIRCNGGFWQDGNSDENRWLEVNHEGEQTIQWPDNSA